MLTDQRVRVWDKQSEDGSSSPGKVSKAAVGQMAEAGAAGAGEPVTTQRLCPRAGAEMPGSWAQRGPSSGHLCTTSQHGYLRWSAFLQAAVESGMTYDPIYTKPGSVQNSL